MKNDLLRLNGKFAIDLNRAYTVTVEICTRRTLWRLKPANVSISVGGMRYEYVLHRRRTIHCLCFEARGDALTREMKIEYPATGIASVEVTRLDVNDDLGKILVIAAHPDDAELSAGALYSAKKGDAFIVTLSAGESIEKISAQYVPGLHVDLASAATSKAIIRTWNSVHTPVLGGVAAERCVNLGLPDSQLMSIAENDVPHDSVTPSKLQRRVFNQFRLPSDANPVFDRSSTVADLAYIIDSWKPKTIIVTDPEVDIHRDHRACAIFLTHALQASTHQATHILLCSVHHRHRLLSHPGQAFSAAFTPTEQDRSVRIFSEVRHYVHTLDDAAVRGKALLFESMCELSHHRMRLVNTFLCLLRLDFSFLSSMPAGNRHVYYNRFLRRTEFFRALTATDFVACMRLVRKTLP